MLELTKISRNRRRSFTTIWGFRFRAQSTCFCGNRSGENGLPFKPQRAKRKTEIELASEEADQLMNDPNAKTYETPQELWDEIGL